MSRLTIEIPSELGRGAATRDSCQARDRRTAIDEATRAFVRWFDCWAGR